jgi:hypothetical protein
MTQITGKIYQQTNAAGTENRFPRTVMEAVLGLNSHLQQQFGALAGIYMPIEGISESKPNQEFVFRKTPNTIKAKALTLDKIKGKTLAWNQLVRNGNFANGTTNWSAWSAAKSSISATNGVLTQTFTPDGGSAYEYGLIQQRVMQVQSHVYMLMLDVKTPTIDANFYVEFGGSSVGAFQTTAGQKQRVTIKNTRAQYNEQLLIYPKYAPTESFAVEYSNIILVDLTLLGREDMTAQEFEDLYPGYHSYSAGKLISNDAEALETVGFNQWDEEWELGYLDQQTGEPTSGGGKRAKNFISVFPSTTYYGKTIATGMRIFEYDADKNLITCDSVVNNETFVTSNKTCFIKFQDGTPSYAHDICINLSDPAKNGTYEPYRKSTMPLNLNAIKVYSHNIWDEAVSTKAIDETTGEQTGNEGTCISSLNHIPVKPSTIYYAKSQYGSGSGNGIYIKQFDANFTPLSSGWDFQNVKNNTFTTSANARYIKFMTLASYGTTYNHDICINVSSSFNGQYEPHGILTIEGLKGAGSVYDEIVGNKYIKRVGSVVFAGTDAEGWQSQAYSSSYVELYTRHLDGIKASGFVNMTASNLEVNATVKYRGIVGRSNNGIISSLDTNLAAWKSFLASNNLVLNYELATPIEYELAEPLPTSMPAGTTEARISPNADGLSAPFCADMTYGMGATEYAETAGVASFALNTQYAQVAARLLTPRTIWGQVFDGSANITGAMTGVSAIDSLMYFDTSNGRIGIGISTPLYNLDVAGTFHAAGNVEIGGTIDAVYGRSLLHSIESSPVEWDTEATPVMEVQPFQVTNEGVATFMQVNTRFGLALQDYDNDGHEFHSASLDYSYDGDTVTCNKSITAPSFIQSSDQRLKTNLSPVALTVEQIASAPAVEFNWVGNGQRGAGSIAQYWEVQLPYNVHRNGDLLTMEYGNIALISAIVCARKIQELENEVLVLKEIINNK